MSVARHPRPPELEGVPVEEIMKKYVGRFREKRGDWAAFEDAKIEGYKRAQHRFIGAGGSGKHGDPTVIPAKNFTLSIMYVPPGQGNAAHTHEVEECFFVLQGHLDVFVEDETGKRITTRLGPWECISCPAGVIHGYQNEFARAGVLPGDARPRQARGDGLRRRGALQAPRSAPEGGVSFRPLPRSFAEVFAQPSQRHARPCAGHPRLSLQGKQGVDGRDNRAFTPVFDGLCPAMTNSCGVPRKAYEARSPGS